MKIKSKIPHMLLPDRLLGCLLYIYLRLYEKSNGKYYLTISLSDPIGKDLDGWGLVGLFDKGYGLSRETKNLIYHFERIDHILRTGALHPGVSSQSPSKGNKTTIRFIQELLKKYKPYESFISDTDLKKIKDDQEVYDTLTQIITVNEQQFKSLRAFIKKYCGLYARKELDGQQNYFLPSNYADEILNMINNPEYIKTSGYNNLRLSSGNSPNFCHTLMYLVIQKKIKIRRLIIAPQSVEVVVDNISGDKRRAANTDSNDYIDNNSDDLVAIKTWISKKDTWTQKKYWQVVSVLNSEWQLRDVDTFKIPIEKFVIDWLDNEHELEAILTNLHSRKIIEVTRKLGETPPSKDSNKPQGSVWATITDEPEIIRKDDAQIRLFTKKFGYLVSKLRDIGANDDKEITSSPIIQQSTAGIEWHEDFQWQDNNFVFGSYGKATLSSPDRIKLFNLLTDAKGNWVTVQKMENETGKDGSKFIRPTLGQIERQLDPKLRKHVTIPSTREDDAGQKPSQGAYRIKFVSNT